MTAHAAPPRASAPAPTSNPRLLNRGPSPPPPITSPGAPAASSASPSHCQEASCTGPSDDFMQSSLPPPGGLDATTRPEDIERSPNHPKSRRWTYQ